MIYGIGCDIVDIHRFEKYVDDKKRLEKLYTENELNEFYKNKSVAHITVSMGELNGIKGKAVDTGKLKFNKLDKILKIKGRIGYFSSGVVFDNSIFN